MLLHKEHRGQLNAYTFSFQYAGREKARGSAFSQMWGTYVLSSGTLLDFDLRIALRLK